MLVSDTLIRDIKAGNVHRKVKNEEYEAIIKPIYNAGSRKNLFTDFGLPRFDPDKHLQYYADGEGRMKFDSTRQLNLSELGISSADSISDIGVSDPFPMFTEEAIEIMREEILSKELFMNYARHSPISTSGLDCIIRGHVKNGDKIDAPFTYAAWTHPKTMELVSKMAGVELEIIMDYEIAHTNIGMDPQANNIVDPVNADEEDAIVGWHYDSYPFVCVLMLSDTSKMIGGETCLRMEGEYKGKIARVQGPQKGSAAVLQGRVIRHMAPKPKNSCERITMVTSYRAKNPLIPEKSVLTTVKPEINSGSRYNDFYPQWVEYRLRIIQDRLKYFADTYRSENGNFDKDRCQSFLKDIEEYVKHTYAQMRMSDEEWEMASQEKFEHF